MKSETMEIVSVNVSREKGTTKSAVPEAVINDHGIVGDAHAGPWHRQVSLLSLESIERFGSTVKREVGPGVFAENLTTRGLDLGRVRILDRLRIGEVDLEVSQIGKACHGGGCAIFREVGRCVMPKEGIFSRVRHGGTVRPGDGVAYFPRTLKVAVITMSDRASNGEYADRSGPRVRMLMEEFLRDRGWETQFDTAVVPDDRDRLGGELDRCRDAGTDIVVTTGGTGIGLRDITPEVVVPRCSKMIPGIMDHIRLKYGADKPNALISRSVAGVMGESLVFALPGSVRAVEEYMGEILKVLEHAIYMLRGLDVHSSPLQAGRMHP